MSRVDASGRPAKEKVRAMAYTSDMSEKSPIPAAPKRPVRYTLKATPTVRMIKDVAESVSVFISSRFVFFIFASEEVKKR